MKKLLFTLAFLVIISCKQSNTAENQKAMLELETFESLQAEKERLKKWTHDYIAAVNSPNWRTEVLSYLQEGEETDNFIKEHTAFRNSFADYKSTVKHVMAEGNTILVWMNITANYTESYSLENSSDNYRDSIFNGIEAKNQPLSWDETWQFSVVDGKFGDEWDFLKDNYAVLKGLGALEN